jgi:hypothetical protein
MIADGPTKPLGREVFSQFVAMLRMETMIDRKAVQARVGGKGDGGSREREGKWRTGSFQCNE